jgi:hypothetical protein
MNDILSSGDPSSCYTFNGLIKASPDRFGWTAIEDIGVFAAKSFADPSS